MSLSARYDQWHQAVNDAEPDHADETSPWYRLVLEYLGDVKSKRVLEVACGRGGFAKLLASRGAIMCGADFSGTALQAGARKSGTNGQRSVHLDFAQADAQQLPFASESFDVIISCETIEHLLDPQAALKEMARICRPGGFLYLTTPNYVNATGLYYLYARGRKAKSTPGADQPFDRVFLFPEIRRLVRQGGWNILRSDGTVHQFPVWRGHNPVAISALESSRGVRRLLSPLALHYFVMARRSNDR
jgi:ubiquinone/menaquinone biosynthesis C-methylase UbiE